jgi:hypothetical protein
MSTCRSRREMIKVNVEERIHLHAVRPDMDQSHVKPARVVQGREQGICDVHLFAVSGDVHHITSLIFATASSNSGCDATTWHAYYLKRNRRQPAIPRNPISSQEDCHPRKLPPASSRRTSGPPPGRRLVAGGRASDVGRGPASGGRDPARPAGGVGDPGELGEWDLKRGRSSHRSLRRPWTMR